MLKKLGNTARKNMSKYIDIVALILIVVFIVSKSNLLEKNVGKSVILLQPFSDFKEKEAKFIYDSLKNIFENVCISKPIDLPQNAYVKKRNRYRADIIIRMLRDQRQEDTISVGLTHFDISTTKDDIEDWGVMGLGYRPGSSCVVSTFRLKKENRNSQLIKVVLHEIGHTLDLSHCKNKWCIMRDAEGGNPLDEEKDYCEKCKSNLRKKGIAL